MKKPTPAEAASTISLEQFDQLLKDTTSKYREDQASQLGIVADFFVSAFKDSDLAFTKVLKQTSVFKVET